MILSSNVSAKELISQALIMNFSFSDDGPSCSSSLRITCDLRILQKMLGQKYVILMRVKQIQELLENSQICKTLWNYSKCTTHPQRHLFMSCFVCLFFICGLEQGIFRHLSDSQFSYQHILALPTRLLNSIQWLSCNRNFILQQHLWTACYKSCQRHILNRKY